MKTKFEVGDFWFNTVRTYSCTGYVDSLPSFAMFSKSHKNQKAYYGDNTLYFSLGLPTVLYVRKFITDHIEFLDLGIKNHHNNSYRTICIRLDKLEEEYWKTGVLLKGPGH